MKNEHLHLRWGRFAVLAGVLLSLCTPSARAAGVVGAVATAAAAAAATIHGFR